MSRDRSLDEFFGGESDDSAVSDAEGDVDGSADPEAEPDGSPEPESDADDSGTETESGVDDASVPSDVEPAAVTYRWEPGGVECADCGATVEQLWSGESGPVCAECKEW